MGREWIAAILAAGVTSAACASTSAVAPDFEPGPVPESYLAQIEYKFRNGQVIQVAGTFSERDETHTSPMGDDWFAEDNLDNLLEQFEILVLMACATDCPDCGQARPLYEELAEDYARDHPGQVAFTEAEIHFNSANFPIAERYNITNTPTVLVFNQGEIIGRLAYSVDFDDIGKMVPRLEGMIPH